MNESKDRPAGAQPAGTGLCGRQRAGTAGAPAAGRASPAVGRAPERRKVKYVSARAQFREEQLLEPLFTEDELAMFKRGRNASKASVSKHASRRNTVPPPALSACWAGCT